MQPPAMLWIRGLIFTVLIPTAVAFFLPRVIDPQAHRRGGFYDAGFLLAAAGALIYFHCLVRFLAAGGTPNISFARHLGFLIGTEPVEFVSKGLYRYTRNPMYVGVLLAVFGHALATASRTLALYGAAVFLFFHLIVVFVEEPHLRATRGAAYERYCQTPRWPMATW